MMFENYLKKNGYKICSIFFIIIMVLIFFTFYFNSNKNITKLNKGWKLYINDELVSNSHTLKEDSFGLRKKNDVITIKNTLPEIDDDLTYLEIESNYTTIEVFVDDEPIFSYGVDNYENNIIVVDCEQYVPLSKDMGGKEIEIKFTVTENLALSSLSGIKMGTYSNLIRSFIKSKLPSIMVGIFLMLLGISLMVFINFGNDLDENASMFTKKLFAISTYCILVGTYILAKKHIFYLIVDVGIFWKYLEYIPLYLSPITLMFFLSGLQNTKTNEYVFNRKLLWSNCMICIVYTLFTFIVQTLNILHFKQTLLPYQMLIIIMFLSLFVNLYTYRRKTNIQYNSFLIFGSLAMLATIIVDVIAYNLTIFNVTVAGFLKENTIILGVMLLLYGLFNSYYMDILQMIEQNAKAKTLKKTAFVDALTGVKNRAWYENYEKSLGTTFTMISMDLNSLKHVNDTMGHDKGDLLIKRFANVLVETFKTNANVVRFGGDEFLVVLEYNDRSAVNLIIDKMNKLIKDVNKKNHDDINVSVSYGIAFSDEYCDMNEGYSMTTNLYKLADSRMYEMKQNIKKELAKKKEK